MGKLITRAFVLRSVPYGENRRMVDLLCENDRLLTCSLQAGKKSNSSNILSQAFVLGEFELFEQKDRCRFDQGELIHAFTELQADWDRLSAAAHLAELFLDALRMQDHVDGVFKLWSYALYALSEGEDPLRDVRAAQFRLLCDMGFTPWLKDCVVCHRSFEDNQNFSFTRGGLACLHHADAAEPLYNKSTKISSGLRACLMYLIKAEPARLFSFQLSDMVRKDFISFSDRWCAQVMERPYKRLQMGDEIYKFSEQLRRKETQS